jgi:hypothetical protein
MCYNLSMTRSQITEAMRLAESDADLSSVDDSLLAGCLIKGFKPVYVTIQVVARMLRDHIQFNGQWDTEMINELVPALRKLVFIV